MFLAILISLKRLFVTFLKPSVCSCQCFHFHIFLFFCEPCSTFCQFPTLCSHHSISLWSLFSFKFYILRHWIIFKYLKLKKSNYAIICILFTTVGLHKTWHQYVFIIKSDINWNSHSYINRNISCWLIPILLGKH